METIRHIAQRIDTGDFISGFLRITPNNERLWVDNTQELSGNCDVYRVGEEVRVYKITTKTTSTDTWETLY